MILGRHPHPGLLRETMAGGGGVGGGAERGHVTESLDKMLMLNVVSDDGRGGGWIWMMISDNDDEKNIKNNDYNTHTHTK